MVWVVVTKGLKTDFRHDPDLTDVGGSMAASFFSLPTLLSQRGIRSQYDTVSRTNEFYIAEASLRRAERQRVDRWALLTDHHWFHPR